MLKEPIVEGAYYEREDGSVAGPATPTDDDTWGVWRIGEHRYNVRAELYSYAIRPEPLRLTRRVYVVPADPAEVVAELLGRYEKNSLSASDWSGGMADAYRSAADLVAEKLGVK